MVRASWQGALLVAFVWLVLALWKRSTPAARTWLWMIATAKFLLVLLIIVEVPVLAPVAVGPFVGGSSETAITYNFGALQPAAFDWMPVLFWAWLFGVFAIVARACSDHSRLRSLAQGSVPVDERVQGIWDEVSSGAKAIVLVHGDVPVPLVFGMLRPRVLLPERLVSQLGDDELRMVLAHEAAHIRRRDTVASLYMFVCFVLFYFHPAVWLARREWQLDREAACDRSAIERTGADAHGYAAMLLKVSAGADRAPVLALSAVPTYRTLERRINEMKQPKNNLRSGRAVWALLALLVSAGAVPVVLTQRQPHFGAGVFETKWPEVKVTQAVKGKQAPREEVVVASTTDTAIAYEPSTATVAVETGYAQAVEPAQAIPTSTPSLVPSSGVAMAGQAAPVTTISPTGGVAMAGQAAPVTTVRPTGVAMAGQASPVTTVRPTGVAEKAVDVRPTGGGPAVSTTMRPTASAQTVDTRASLATVPRADMTSVTPTSDPFPSTVTFVMRDRDAKGGSGLDTLVSLDLDDVALTDFFKFLSSVTKVKIASKGLRSGMRLNAQIDRVTLGEVMGTLAKVYKLEWKLEGDGSITVQPFRK